jgi:ribosomal protein L10
MASFKALRTTAAEKPQLMARIASVFAKSAAEKTKTVARIGVLNADILAEKDNIRKASLEIGKLYYEYFKADPHAPMKELCDKIAASYAAIDAKKAEIERLKADDPEAAAEAEVVETEAAETENSPEEDTQE